MRRIASTTVLVAVAAGLITALVGGPVAGAAPAPSNVRVINTAAEPVPVSGNVETSPAGELVQHQRGIILSPGNFAPTSFPFYDVPEGKRLVVEQITGHLVMSNGAEMYVRVGQAGVGPHHVLAFPQLDPNSEDNFIQRASTTQQMSFFVDSVPGSTAEFDVEIMRLGDTSDTSLAQTITMVGRLYDL